MGGAGAADPANTRSLNYGANENKAVGANVFNGNNANEIPAFIRITAIRGKNAGSSHGLMTLENGEEIVVGQVISRADFERIFWNASKSDGSFSFVPVQDAQGTTAPNTVEQTVVIKTPDPLAPGSNPGTSSGEGGNTGHEAGSQTGAGSGTGSSTGNGANTGANAGTGTANNGTDPNNTTGQQSGNDKGDGTAQNTGSPSGTGEASNQSASSGDGTAPAGGKPGAEGSGSENKPVTGSGSDSTSGSASGSGSTSGSDLNNGSGSDKGGSTPSEGQSSQASNGQAPSQNAGGQGSESQTPPQTPSGQGSSEQTTSPNQGSPSGEQTPAQNTAGQGSESQPPAQTPGSQGSSEQTTSPTQGSPSGEQTPAQNTAGQGSESQPPAQTPGSQGSSEQTTSPTQGSSSGEQTPPQNAGGGSDTGTPGAGESTQTGGAQTGSAQTGTSETESSGTGDNGKQTSDGGQNGAADGDAKHEGDGTKGEDGEQGKNGEDTASPSNPPTTTSPPTPPDYAPNQSVQQAIHANNKPVGASIFNGTNPAHAPSFVKITAVLDKDGGEVSDAMTLGKEGEAITTDQVISKEQFDNVFLDALKAPGGSFKFIPVMDSEGTEMPGATEQTVSIGFDYVHHFQSEPFREGYEGEDRFSYYRIHSLTEHQDTNGTLDGMFKLDGGERTTLKLGDLIRPEDFDKLYWDYSSNNGGRFTLVGVDASGRDLTDEKNQNMVLEEVAKTRTGRLPPDEPGGEETDVEDSEDSNDIAGHSAALHPESFTDAASAFHGSSHLSVNGQSTLDNLLEHQVSHGIL